jgi:acetylornithine deacetylase/succinyl-diaminopimelate desuccinylase-like protein
MLQAPEADLATVAALAAALAEGHPAEFELLHQHRDGHRFWARLTVVPLPDDAGRPVFVLAILADATAAREEGALQAALRNRQQALDEAQERLRAAVVSAAPSARVEFRGFRARGYAFDPESRFVRLLGDCHEEARGGRPRPEPSRATTDLRFFEGEAVCYGPTGDGLHGVDEWVDLESIADVATVLALLLRRWGGAAG